MDTDPTRKGASDDLRARQARLSDVKRKLLEKRLQGKSVVESGRDDSSPLAQCGRAAVVGSRTTVVRGPARSREDELQHSRAPASRRHVGSRRARRGPEPGGSTPRGSSHDVQGNRRSSSPGRPPAVTGAAAAATTSRATARQQARGRGTCASQRRRRRGRSTSRPGRSSGCDCAAVRRPPSPESHGAPHRLR